MAATSQNFLRQRNVPASDNEPKAVVADESPDDQVSREEVVWGKTPGGEGTVNLISFFVHLNNISSVFRVPTTHDFLSALFHPAHPKSHLDILNLGLLGLQFLVFFYLPRSTASVFFVFYFAFWRSAYDAGLGWVLTKQSKKKWIVREVQRLGWLDEKRCPKIRNWIRAQLAGKMGKDYSFDVRAVLS